MTGLIFFYLEAKTYITFNILIPLIFPKYSLSLTRYRKNRFGNRVTVIKAAFLDNDYRIFFIEVALKFRVRSTINRC